MDDEQQFCLKWNNHQSTLVSVFDSLLRRNQLLDCTLAAEGRSLKAHKVILSACSPYFESLLADYYDKHPVFILKDVKFKELEAMMDYMYRGEVNVSQDQLGPLLKAAESLQIKGLSDNRRESRSNNEDRKREPPILPPRDRTPPPAPSLPQVKGLVIEQKKVDIMNMNNREGSQSPGRRKKRRRQSIDADAGNDSSIENHDGASNGSSSVSVSQPIVPPNVPLNDSRSELSAASSVKTKTEENMPQVPLKQKLEPHSELMLEPKSEYIEEDMNDDSIEDLTLDDDELDMDHNRPGPSHGGQGDGSNQGFGWQMDPSQDETFMAAQEAVGQHRDAQAFFAQYNICPKCFKQFKNVNSLSSHLYQTCGKASKYECEYCNMKFLRSFNLRRHIMNKHTIKSEFNRSWSSTSTPTSTTTIVNTTTDNGEVIKIWK
ncbi:longitudinals lacking protein, isoforms H/M/V isoform X34 [Chrysoperla carnea]|uniref:longitudinals lacking protein, isoforms H/M/V isoform X34 n=1 Tax=Chrysoperla carnea TaxID=189513 RepID=UPI001D0825DA|nr:longitudinals lacking protein, isoforms H/M/V isoform X34 [Chrysoperla carnea]